MDLLADQRRCAVAHGLRLVAPRPHGRLVASSLAASPQRPRWRGRVQAVPTDATAYLPGWCATRWPAMVHACHGPNGNSQNPTGPKLAGQRQQYLLQQPCAGLQILASAAPHDGRGRPTCRPRT